MASSSLRVPQRVSSRWVSLQGPFVGERIGHQVQARLTPIWQGQMYPALQPLTRVAVTLKAMDAPSGRTEQYP